MFGLSLSKLIVLIAVFVVVWYGLNWVKRLNGLRRRREEAERRLQARRDADRTEEMVRCAFCDTFVSACGARHCGRPRCPYPR